MECALIWPHLYFGSCPTGPEDIIRLQSEYGITAVLNLQSDADRCLYGLDWNRLAACYCRLGIELRLFPIQDKSEADLTRKLGPCIIAIDDLLEEGHTVFVHCNIGNGRSPTVVTAWLYSTIGTDLAAAARHVQNCRPCEPNLNVIRAAEHACRLG